MFIRVLLPEPLAPISATNSAAGDLQGNPFEHRQIQLTQVVSLADVVKFDQFHILPTLHGRFQRGRRREAASTLPGEISPLRHEWTRALTLALTCLGFPFAFTGDHLQALGQSFAADFRPRAVGQSRRAH